MCVRWIRGSKTQVWTHAWICLRKFVADPSPPIPLTHPLLLFFPLCIIFILILEGWWKHWIDAMNKPGYETGEMALSGKCLSSKHEDLNPIPSTHLRKSGMPVIPGLGRRRHRSPEIHWPAVELISRFNGRPSLKKPRWGMNEGDTCSWCLTSACTHLHMHIHAWTWAHKCSWIYWLLRLSHVVGVETTRVGYRKSPHLKDGEGLLLFCLVFLIVNLTHLQIGNLN